MDSKGDGLGGASIQKSLDQSRDYLLNVNSPSLDDNSDIH